jgi:predicted metal-dependent peptidase
MAQASKIEQARLRIIVKNPFFASLMLNIPMVCDPTLNPPTMATDMKTIWYHPQFVEDNSVDVIEFAIVHEVMHVALEHCIRIRGRNPYRWNAAADYVINPVLKDQGFVVWEHALLKDEYRNMMAEQVYNLLEKEEKDDPQQGGGQGQPQPGDGQPQPGQGQPQPGQGQPHPMYQPGGRHYSPMHGDIKAPEESQDPGKEEQLSRETKNMVAQAAAMARMAGTMTESLDRFCDAILNPKVPWQILLREFMTSTRQGDETWNVRDRRIADFFFPSDEEEKLGPIVLGGDTSGSIGDDELGKMTVEGAVIAEDMRPESIRLVWCDSKVKGEQYFEEGDVVVPKPVGGGGTDMRVLLRHVEKYNPEIVVLFTDGYTPWPTGPTPYPLIVCCTTDHDVPDYLGRVVRI